MVDLKNIMEDRLDIESAKLELMRAGYSKMMRAAKKNMRHVKSIDDMKVFTEQLELDRRALADQEELCEVTFRRILNLEEQAIRSSESAEVDDGEGQQQD